MLHVGLVFLQDENVDQVMLFRPIDIICTIGVTKI